MQEWLDLMWVSEKTVKLRVLSSFESRVIVLEGMGDRSSEHREVTSNPAGMLDSDFMLTERVPAVAKFSNSSIETF